MEVREPEYRVHVFDINLKFNHRFCRKNVQAIWKWHFPGENATFSIWRWGQGTKDVYYRRALPVFGDPSLRYSSARSPAACIKDLVPKGLFCRLRVSATPDHQSTAIRAVGMTHLHKGREPAIVICVVEALHEGCKERGGPEEMNIPT